MSHQQEWATYRLQLTLLDSQTLDESLDQAISMVDKEFQARIETAQDKLEDEREICETKTRDGDAVVPAC